MKLQIGESYKVTVVKIMPFGAIVELEDGTQALVHISKIANCYIEDIGDFISVGREYTATAVASDIKPVELSFLDLGLKSFRPTSHSYNAAISAEHARNLERMLEESSRQYEDKHKNKRRNSSSRRR